MKNIIPIIFITITFFNFKLYAQELSVVYKTEFDINKMVIDKEKNIILSGNFYGAVDFDLSSDTSKLNSIYSDLFIAKYNSLLNFKWAFSVQGGFENPSSILTDDQDNIYITGTAFGLADFDPSSDKVYFLSSDPENYNDFLVKYDKNGLFQWAKISNGQIINIVNNSIYQQSYDTIKKIDSNGNEIWAKYINTQHEPVFDNKNSFYYLIDSANQWSTRPLTLYKIDTSGNIQFVRNLTEGSNSQFNFDVYGDPSFRNEHFNLSIVNEKLFIVANYWGDIDFDPGFGTNFAHNADRWYDPKFGFYHPSFKKFIAIYDLNGAFELLKENGQNPYIVKSNYSGNIFIIGAFSDSIDISLKNNIRKISSPGDALYIAEYDSSFDLLSAVKLTEMYKYEFGSYKPQISSLYFDKSYTILTGNFNNIYLNQDSITYPDYAPCHIAIYKDFKIPPLNINYVEPLEATLQIFPNPSNEYLNIMFSHSILPCRFKIYNINGQLILSKNAENNLLHLDISSFNNGLYLFEISNDKQIYFGKFIKE